MVLIDDRGQRSDYWSRSYASRLAADGNFQIKVPHPAKVDGQYRILFCFENGVVSGDGTNIGFANRGDVRKAYHFRDANGDLKSGVEPPRYDPK